MKLVALLIAAAAAAAVPSGRQSDADFVTVSLPPPHNWISGRRLFRKNVIEGLNANITAYTADSWTAHVLAACRNQTACTSCISYSAFDSGSTSDRSWFGYVFRGGPTSVSDYMRDEEAVVNNSVAYSIVA